MSRLRFKTLCLVPVLIVGFIGVACHGQAKKPCLSYAYPKGQSPVSDLKFDTAFDRVNRYGASFSCGPAIAASKARDALESFRYGVLYHDTARLNEAIRYPLTVAIFKTLHAQKREDVVLHNAKEWFRLQKQRMTKIEIEMIACSWLGNVTVTAGYKSPGFFIGLGMVWFQHHGESARVWVTSVNLDPDTPNFVAESCAP